MHVVSLCTIINSGKTTPNPKILSTFSLIIVSSKRNERDVKYKIGSYLKEDLCFFFFFFLFLLLFLVFLFSIMLLMIMGIFYVLFILWICNLFTGLSRIIFFFVFLDIFYFKVKRLRRKIYTIWRG